MIVLLVEKISDEQIMSEEKKKRSESQRQNWEKDTLAEKFSWLAYVVISSLLFAQTKLASIHTLCWIPSAHISLQISMKNSLCCFNIFVVVNWRSFRMLMMFE